MADPIIGPEFEQSLANSGIDTVAAPPSDVYVPKYRVVGDSRVPVSKAYGALWRRRLDASRKRREDIEKLWDEVNLYYENEQSGHRNEVTGETPAGDTQSSASGLSPRWSETENVIYSHNASMLPTIYSQAPTVEFTAEDRNSPEEAAFATAYERVCNVLINMRCAPGLNLHPKLRRAVLSAQLTNYAVAEISWVDRGESADSVAEQLQMLSDELAAATETKDIERIEGKLMAIEENVDILNPPGPMIQMLGLKDLYPDPECLEPDWSDAKWIIKRTFLPTSYIKAVYAAEYGDDDECRSLYEPTHVLHLGVMGDVTHDDPALGWSLFSKDGSDQSKVGDKQDKAYYTEVFYVWDKVTRRVFLYHGNGWTWPLWVWDDPLKLDRFFPFYRLWFNETLGGNYAHSEATYTLDQQDAINSINSEHKRWREWSTGNWLYNSNKLSQEEATAVLRGPDRKPRGVALDEGVDFESVVKAVLPPSAEYAQLFDKGPVYAAFDRITSTSPAIRGQEFRTNTTNEAVQTYNAAAATRLGEKIDALENWIADIMWGITQLINLRMDPMMLIDLIGQEAAKGWKRVAPRELRTRFAMRVVAGSTQKPTSEMKKREAIQVGQVLGQFATNPVVAAAVARMFSTAFESVVITDTDLAKIGTSMDQPQQPNAGTPPGAEARIRDVLSRLPPDKKAQLEAMVQQGVPASQALAELGVTIN